MQAEKPFGGILSLPETALFKYHKLFIMNAKTAFTRVVYVCLAMRRLSARILLWLITASVVFVMLNLNKTGSEPVSTK